MDEAVADIIRRLAEWREDTRATFEKLAAQSTDTAHDLKPDEVTKSLRETLAFYGLATKYHETMGRLSRFFNENSTEEKRSKLPEVAWWQKLKKLFEIEESFYKHAKEAFAADNLGDYEIYSGLAKEALDQVQSAIEKVDNPSPVADAEVGTESAQKRKAWPGLLGKVVEFYLQKEGLIFLAAVSLFLGMQVPLTDVGSGYPLVDGLFTAILYGFGLYMVYGFCKAAKDVAVNAKEAAVKSGAPLSLRKYIRVGVAIITIIYGSAFLEAKANPWTLWKRSWGQFQSEVEMKKMGLYTTQKTCVDDQWKLLKEELLLKKSVAQEAEYKTAYIVEGRTIFEFGKSLYSGFPEPEIVSTISFFCASTSKNALWPFHTPNYYAPGEALTNLGERTLTGRAEKILGE